MSSSGYTRQDLVLDAITALALCLQMQFNYQNGFDLVRDSATLLGTFLIRFGAVFSASWLRRYRDRVPADKQPPNGDK